MVIMVALGIILHRLEALLPLPRPSIKLSLANLMTLVSLVILVFKEAVIVTFLQVVIGSILWETLALMTGLLIGSISNTLSSQMQNINFKKLHENKTLSISYCFRYYRKVIYYYDKEKIYYDQPG
jgi:heptaprenyl diphosphate synthase